MDLRKLAICGLAVSLSACSTLPSNGPTAAGVRKDIADPASQVQMQIVEVDNVTALPVSLAENQQTFPDRTPPPSDMIGPGDVLNIVIYEAGVTLFGSDASKVEGAAFDPSVKAQTLPAIRVSDSGTITLPYVGELNVLGKTVGEVQQQIGTSLRRLSQNPQVIVTLREVINNSVIVGGEVAKPGRLVLQTNRESLSDVIALAGGYRGTAKDLTLRIIRRGENVDLRLTDLVENPSLDIRAYPGDRLMLISDPRTFSVLGASGRVEQLPFSAAHISLAEAVASSGGVNPNAGDPKAVFVFRFVPDETGKARPTVYHMNMMKAGSLFLSQRFQMRNKDVLYIGNAPANQPSKLIQLVSQLFAPLASVVTAAAVVHNY
jgi:polysaccharide export outer membrane protein